MYRSSLTIFFQFLQFCLDGEKIHRESLEQKKETKKEEREREGEREGGDRDDKRVVGLKESEKMSQRYADVTI